MTLFTRTLIYAVYLGVVALVNLPAIQGVIQLSTQDASASHHVLIPLVTLALVYRDRKAVFSSVSFDLKSGAVLFAAGIALIVLAHLNGAVGPGGLLSAAMGGGVLLALAGFLACFGRQPFRRALFPLAFLMFTVPIPDIVLNNAVAVLKRGSTEAVAILFGLSGTPFHREGYVFTLRDFVIEVADQCSGIRSSIALVLTTLLAGHLFLRATWKKAVLVLAIFPLTIFKNGIRIVTLSLLAMHVDPGFLTGQLHHEGGILFFVLALALLFPLFAALAKSDAGGSARRRLAVDVPRDPSEAISL
jgi:exosortase